MQVEKTDEYRAWIDGLKDVSFWSSSHDQSSCEEDLKDKDKDHAI